MTVEPGETKDSPADSAATAADSHDESVVTAESDKSPERIRTSHITYLLVGGASILLLTVLEDQLGNWWVGIAAILLYIAYALFQRATDPLLDWVDHWLAKVVPRVHRADRRLVVTLALIAVIAWILWPVGQRVSDSLSITASQLTLADTPLPFQESDAEGWGDSDGGRPTVPYNDETTAPADVPRFNAISGDLPGHPMGDERNFVGVGRFDNHWSDKVDVEVGDVIQMVIYVHNNAGSHLNGDDFRGPGVALGTRLIVRLPDEPQSRLVLRAWITSENSQPRWVTDSATLSADEQVRVEPVIASTQRFQDGAFATVNDASALFTEAGLSVGGVSTQPGVYPGCWDHRSLYTVTLRVVKQ